MHIFCQLYRVIHRPLIELCLLLHVVYINTIFRFTLIVSVLQYLLLVVEIWLTWNDPLSLGGGGNDTHYSYQVGYWRWCWSCCVIIVSPSNFLPSRWHVPLPCTRNDDVVGDNRVPPVLFAAKCPSTGHIMITKTRSRHLFPLLHHSFICHIISTTTTTARMTSSTNDTSVTQRHPWWQPPIMPIGVCVVSTVLI